MKEHEKSLLLKIDDVIKRNLDNPNFQLADISDELKVSRAKLYRDTAKLTGLAPSKYVRNKRLNQAKLLLENGVFPTVKETASAVGFRRPEYFTKIFSKTYKVLPKEVLKSAFV